MDQNTPNACTDENRHRIALNSPDLTSDYALIASETESEPMKIFIKLERLAASIIWMKDDKIWYALKDKFEELTQLLSADSDDEMKFNQMDELRDFTLWFELDYAKKPTCPLAKELFLLIHSLTLDSMSASRKKLVISLFCFKDDQISNVISDKVHHLQQHLMADPRVLNNWKDVCNFATNIKMMKILLPLIEFLKARKAKEERQKAREERRKAREERRKAKEEA